MLRTLAVILILPSLALGAAFKLGGVYDKTSVGLANVNNTSDAAKPVSTAQQTALDLKADKTSTVTITAPEFDTSAADGTLRANFRNTVAFSATPAIGDCQYASYLSPAGWYCYTGSAWQMQGGGGVWGGVTGTLANQTDLWNKFQTYMLKSDHDTYAAAMQVKFANMSATVNALRIAVVAGGAYVPPDPPTGGGSCSSGAVNVSHLTGSGSDGLIDPTTVLGQGFQVASNGTLYSIKVSTGLSGAGGPVKLRWGNTADLRTTYYDEVSVNVTGDSQTLEFVAPSHHAVTTGTQYYWAVTTGSGFTGTLYVGKEGTGTYAGGVGYADSVLWNLSTSYGDDKKFEVYLCN